MHKLTFISAIAALAMTGAVHAAVITVNLNHGALVESNGSVNQGENYPAVGAFGGFNGNAGYSFLLPTITAGEVIDSVVFHAGTSSSYWASDGAQLLALPSEVYALRIDPATSFLATDYGSGATQPGTQVSTGFFTGTLGVLPPVDITSWLTSTGYVAGDYLLLRTATTADETTITNNGARWWTDASTLSNAQLVITTSAIPEPASLALLALGGPALLRRRRA